MFLTNKVVIISSIIRLMLSFLITAYDIKDVINLSWESIYFIGYTNIEFLLYFPLKLLYCPDIVLLIRLAYLIILVFFLIIIRTVRSRNLF